jgi:hypothetical protein
LQRFLRQVNFRQAELFLVVETTLF